MCHIKLAFFLERSGQRVLDVGCGRGTYIKALMDKGKCVLGIDNNRELVRYAQKKIKGDYLVGDVYHLPFKETSFETATVGDLLEHLENDVAALKEISRVAPKILVSFPRVELIEHDPTHLRMYNRELLMKTVYNAGLHCDAIINWFPSPYAFLRVLAKMIAWLYPSGFLCEISSSAKKTETSRAPRKKSKTANLNEGRLR